MQLRSLFAWVGLCLAVHGCSATGGLKRPVPCEAGPVPAAHRGLDPQELALANASYCGGLPVDTNAEIGPAELIFRQA